MPLVTPRGTLFHMPKTGGTWLQQVLVEQFEGQVAGRGHCPVWDFPEATAPTFGVVRDPWSWYGSLYRFAVKARRWDGIAYWGASCEEDWSRKTRFRAFLYGLTHPGEVPVFEPGSLGVVFELVQRERFEKILREERSGFCSFLASYMFGANEAAGHPRPRWQVDAILDQANLQAQLGTLFGCQIAATKKDAFNKSEHVRTEFESPRYVDWYDEEMFSWVAEADGWYIQEFGFDAFGAAEHLPMLA